MGLGEIGKPEESINSSSCIFGGGFGLVYGTHTNFDLKSIGMLDNTQPFSLNLKKHSINTVNIMCIGNGKYRVQMSVMETNNPKSIADIYMICDELDDIDFKSSHGRHGKPMFTIKGYQYNYKNEQNIGTIKITLKLHPIDTSFESNFNTAKTKLSEQNKTFGQVLSTTLLSTGQ